MKARGPLEETGPRRATASYTRLRMQGTSLGSRGVQLHRRSLYRPGRLGPGLADACAKCSARPPDGSRLPPTTPRSLIGLHLLQSRAAQSTSSSSSCDAASSSPTRCHPTSRRRTAGAGGRPIQPCQDCESSTGTALTIQPSWPSSAGRPRLRPPDPSPPGRPKAPHLAHVAP